MVAISSHLGTQLPSVQVIWSGEQVGLGQPDSSLIIRTIKVVATILLMLTLLMECVFKTIMRMLATFHPGSLFCHHTSVIPQCNYHHSSTHLNIHMYIYNVIPIFSFIFTSTLLTVSETTAVTMLLLLTTFPDLSHRTVGHSIAHLRFIKAGLFVLAKEGGATYGLRAIPLVPGIWLRR